MRKTGLILLSLALILAFSAPALAETKVEFNGYYRVRYFQLDNFGVQKDGSNGYSADHRGYFDQKFQLKPKFIVSDCLQLNMTIHALYGNRWGQAASGDGTDYIAYDATKTIESEFTLSEVYGVVDTAIGEFRFGRMTIGVAGLALLGYSGSRFADASGYLGVSPFDWDWTGHRIGWFKKWGNFGLTVLYQKDNERDVNNAGAQFADNTTAAASAGYDDDQDQFWVLPQYEWKNGSANMLFAYIRGRSWNEQGNYGYDPTFWNIAMHSNAAAGGAAGYLTTATDWDAYMFNPAVVMNFGPVSIHGEFNYMWAKFRPDEQLYTNSTLMPNVTADGWGLWLDAIYNYGPGEAGAMFSYLSGRNFNDTDLDSNMHGILGMTDTSDHTVFLVAYDRGLLANMELCNTGPYQAAPFGYSNINNHWMLGAYNDYNITDDFMVHAALGYFQLTNAPDNYTSATYGVLNNEDIKKDLGVELDVGAYYKIMDGLDFSSVFGYFWTGNAWKYGVSAAELGNAYAWKNQLVLHF